MLSCVGRTAMRLACRLKKSGGIIINEHTLSAEEARAHVDALGRWFEFIHADELPGRLVRGGRKPFCLMTFDDGHRSNATQAAPELERLGVPATFLVVSEFVGAETALWFTLYARLCRKLGAPPPGLGPLTVKQLPHDVLLERLERACRKHGVEPDLADEHAIPMTWDQARDLSRRGFDVGSHGAEHAVMTRLPRERAFGDISRSIARVSAELGRPCTSFAFPNGNYTAELARHAASCGARLVFTAEPTWTDARFPLWKLPRIQLFGGQDRAWMELKVALAAAEVCVPSGDGTKLAYRYVNRLAALRRPAVDFADPA